MYFRIGSERRRIVAKQIALKRRQEAKAKRNAEKRHAAAAALHSETTMDIGEKEGEKRGQHGKYLDWNMMMKSTSAANLSVDLLVGWFPQRSK